MITFSNRARGTLMVVAGALLLSVQGLLIRQVTADRWTLIYWRGFLMFVSLAIGMIICWRRRSLSRFLAIGWPGLIAAVILAVSNILFVTAFTLTSIANTLVLANSAPLLVAILSWLILREKVPLRTWIAVLLGLAGIGVIFHGSLTGVLSSVGDLCAFGAAITFAGYLIFLRHAKAINMLPSLALAGLLFSLFVLPWARPFSITATDLGLLILIGGISLPAGMALVTLSPRYIPATEVEIGRASCRERV